ncbi:MAG: hypothetical protein DDT32_00690 [Syntrophomonadaceae bacterium]|nr:hypothetical protein [Bacillota bacterium]
MIKDDLGLNIDSLKHYAEAFNMPIEDAMFIALNFYGVHMDVPYNRMRMGFHLNGEDSLFVYANNVNDLNYYFALPINYNSPFRIVGEELYLLDYIIGKAIGATEDFCDSHYPRRLGTSLNINPNSRTSCRGCSFCYTAYQVPLDKKRMRNSEDIDEFLRQWMDENNNPDLSHLIQVSVVTGCYDSEDDLVGFLLQLNDVLKKYAFAGKIFYLGSMLTSPQAIEKLTVIDSFGYCLSLECFERRDILKNSKARLTLQDIKTIMQECLSHDFEVNYTYVMGMDSMEVFLPHMQEFIEYTNKFPTINILQLHKQHNRSLLDDSVRDVTYFYRAREIIQELFKPTRLRPLVWEDYRTLWYLKFADEPLTGDRFPELFWKNKITRGG